MDTIKEKIDQIREYLNAEFHGYEIVDQPSFDRIGQTFRVLFDNSILLTTVQDIFLKTTDANEIQPVLKKWELANHMKITAGGRVVVTPQRLVIEKQVNIKEQYQSK